MTDINIGAFGEALNDKLDRNGLNAEDSFWNLIFSKIAAGLAMDVERTEPLVWGEEFIVSKPGWLVGYAKVNHNEARIFIDGQDVWTIMNNNYADGMQIPIYVAAGQTITYGGSWYQTPTVKFIPCKGV